MEKHVIRRSPLVEVDASLKQLHPLLQRIYSHRGISTYQEIDYRFSNLLRPDLLKGLDTALALLTESLQSKQRICIIGDFDADGATSTALAVKALTEFGAENVSYIVPNRFEYGYGLTPEIVDLAATNKPDLIITVDNGISSIQGVERAKSLGIKVLVTDHHLPGNELPEAEAIVNPNQSECPFPSKNLAGVGVIFYLMSALRTHLQKLNWFEEKKIPLPNMAAFLDLVALGTVADVVPLDQNNRILVDQGLQRIRAGRVRPGILALIEIANRSITQLTSTDLGFALGPRLNAAGRLDDMSIGIQCLLSDSPYQAQALARELDNLNQERKSIESSMKVEAMSYLQALNLNEEALPAGVCVYKEDWHQGVIGILASRIKDKIHRPTIVFAQSDNGEIKGSARSVDGIHIRDVLDEIAVTHPGLIIKFGGHAMAAGLTMQEKLYQRFCQAFDQVVDKHAVDDQLAAKIYTDGGLSEQDINLSTAELIEKAGPWGQHFPMPLFDGVFFVVSVRVLANKHLKMIVAENEFSAHTFDAIWFNTDIAEFGQCENKKLHFVYSVNVNEFRGVKSVQLMVEHAKYC